MAFDSVCLFCKSIILQYMRFLFASTVVVSFVFGDFVPFVQILVCMYLHGIVLYCIYWCYIHFIHKYTNSNQVDKLIESTEN